MMWNTKILDFSLRSCVYEQNSMLKIFSSSELWPGSNKEEESKESKKK